MRSRGFSLVECLACLAVIAILAAVLIPALGRARASAQSVKCLSNQRQIALAIISAAQDQGNVYPPGQDGSNVSWVYTLEPYYGSKTSGLLVCPSRSFKPPGSGNSWLSSYSLNPRIMVDLASETPRRVMVSGVPRPSEVILVADGGLRSIGAAHGRFWQVDTANDGNPWPGNADKVISDGPNIDNGTACFRFRHGDRVNVAFADGHVGTFTKGTIRYRNLHIAY